MVTHIDGYMPHPPSRPYAITGPLVKNRENLAFAIAEQARVEKNREWKCEIRTVRRCETCRRHSDSCRCKKPKLIHMVLNKQTYIELIRIK